MNLTKTTMKKVIILIMCTLFAINVFPQSKISGRIVDIDSNPLEYATVALYRVSDNTLQQGAVTNIDGRFTLDKISAGRYFITVSMIGYVKANSDPISVVNDKNYDMPDFILYEDVHKLEEIVVEAKKNFVEQQADKMVINPEASITTASDDVLEVLRKSPGIIVDRDDNITLKNKQVKVMIDGRPTYISGSQLADMLRNMQATSIERIEIIENPPSRYDAEGEAGIINIRTKHGMMRGYNGSLNVSGAMGKRFSDNYGLNINYRNSKWNIYGNYNGGDQRRWYDLDLTRNFHQSNIAMFQQNNEQTWETFYGNAKLGIDYYITPKHIVGIMARGNFSQNKDRMDSNGDMMNATNELLQNSKTHTNTDGEYKNMLLNLNYKWTIDSLGQELSVDADMAQYRSSTINDLYTSYTPPMDPLNMHKNEAGKSGFYSIKADYVLPVGKKMRVESGFKSSWANIDSDLKILNQDVQGNWADPEHLSNHFVYNENINAAYLSGRYTLSERTSIQLGFRGEQTIAKGDNKTSNEAHTQRYFNLFPSFFFQQRLSDNHQVGFSYSYRIGRPPYDFLNPFIYILDPYTFSQGNPYLNPQYTHASKLSYTLQKKYIVSLDFSYTEDARVRFFKQDDQNQRVIATWANLNDYYNASVTVVVPVQITKWWNTNTSITGLYGQYNSQDEESDINKSQYSIRGNTTFTFTLPKKFSMELSAWYVSKGVYGVVNGYPQGAVNMGVQKTFADSKASVKLSVSDVFKTQNDKYFIKYDNIDVRGRERFDSRRVNLTFTYRFGRNDIKAARQRLTGLEEETSRKTN